jgi:hypothetical protein
MPSAAKGIHARFTGEVIEIALERELGRDWAESPGKISLEANEPLEGRGPLSILIEKDFFCRSPRSRPEDESDLFPNPHHACGAKAMG